MDTGGTGEGLKLLHDYKPFSSPHILARSVARKQKTSAATTPPTQQPFYPAYTCRHVDMYVCMRLCMYASTHLHGVNGARAAEGQAEEAHSELRRHVLLLPKQIHGRVVKVARLKVGRLVRGWWWWWCEWRLFVLEDGGGCLFWGGVVVVAHKSLDSQSLALSGEGGGGSETTMAAKK
jgi:hypothetical protein